MNKHMNITNRTFAAAALSLVAIAGLGLSCTNASANVAGPISEEALQLTEYRWVGSALIFDELTGAELLMNERGTVLAPGRIEARQLAESAMLQRACECGKVLRLFVEVTGSNS